MAEGQNLAIANVILKDVYGDINEQINNATPALDGIKSTARNITQVGGLGVKFVAHVGRNTGIGARGEDEDLPEAGNQQYVDGQTGLKSFYGSVRLTGQVMAQASQNYQTFADVTSEEIERIRVAGKIAAGAVEAVGAAIAPGVTTDQLDGIAQGNDQVRGSSVFARDSGPSGRCRLCSSQQVGRKDQDR